MEKEFLKSRLETEQERCLSRLAELTPGSEEYTRCLDAARCANDWLSRDDEAEDEQCGTVIGFAPAPVHIANDAPEQFDAPAPITPAMKKEDVRAALADARMKGVDVSKLIADMGAPNLTGVDPADYPKLMAALAKELEGK